MRERVRGVAVVIAAAFLLALPLPAASLPTTGWIPNTIAAPPFPNIGSGGPSFFHTTRRIVPQQRVPGRFLMGHALFGLFQSVPGFGWAPLIPQCLGIIGSMALQPALGALPGCGVEGIAFDESADSRAPLNVYASTFNIDLLAPGTPISHGGVFKAEIQPRSGTKIGSAGLIWRPLLTGMRGNGLAVQRTGSAPATIVVGRIQRNSGDVGVDSNAWCAPAACQPSVYVSHDDGVTWQVHTFNGSPCATGVPTSSRLVGAVAFDSRNSNVVYAAANSGLWVSKDNAATWSTALSSCGNAPGFAITKRTLANNGRIYVGQNTDALLTSEIYSAATGPAGPGAFTKLALQSASSGAAMSLPGWVQSIQIDERDTSERTMFVSTWRNAGSSGGGLGGVWRIVDQGNGTATVVDLKASFLEPFADCFGIAPGCLRSNKLPYPLIFDPAWRSSLFLAQHPLEPDLIYASSVYGGVWTRSDGNSLL